MKPYSVLFLVLVVGFAAFGGGMAYALQGLEGEVLGYLEENGCPTPEPLEIR